MVAQIECTVNVNRCDKYQRRERIEPYVTWPRPMPDTIVIFTKYKLSNLNERHSTFKWMDFDLNIVSNSSFRPHLNVVLLFQYVA